jgi:hypothetical protein
MEMVTIGLAALGMFFFVMGHSTLLFFLIEDNKKVTLSWIEVVFPSPQRGRVVSYLCLLLTCFFWGMLIFSGPNDFNVRGLNHWKLLLGFVFSPLAIYVNYLIHRCKVENGKLVFTPTHSTYREYRLIVAVTLLAMLVYKLLEEF